MTLQAASIPLAVACVECGARIELHSRPRVYCSDKCRQVLKLVHYGRRVVRDGRIDDPLVEDALRMRVAHILAGGYRQKARYLRPDQRVEVFIRDKGLCQLCGKPATDVDHIAGDSNRLSNLRALCRTCNMDMAKRHQRPARAHQAAVATELLERVLSPQPMFPRDNEANWGEQYRLIVATQRTATRKARGAP